MSFVCRYCGKNIKAIYQGKVGVHKCDKNGKVIKESLIFITDASYATEIK
jgi:hypothetical protein